MRIGFVYFIWSLLFIVLALNWDLIPEQVPVQIRPGEESPRLEEKSFSTVFFGPIVGVVATGLVHSFTIPRRLAITPADTYKSKSGVELDFSPALAQRMDEQVEVNNRCLNVIACALVVLFLQWPLQIIPRFNLGAGIRVALWVIGFALLFGPVIYMLVKISQILEKFPLDDTAKARQRLLRNQTQLFTLGTYKNSLDPHQLVPSMISETNLTPNLAHSEARSRLWVSLSLLCVLIVFVILWIVL